MKICVYGAASSEIDELFIEAGKDLGRKMVERGHSLVFGGGRGGMMGAVASGAAEKGGEIIGISPKFFEENNAEIIFPNCTTLIQPDTMRQRKGLLDETSDAFIMAPGGIGTFDEFFEILTLKQLGRHNKAIVVFNVDGYYDNLLKMMEWSIEKKFITEDCVDMYKVTTTAEETLDYIEKYVPEDIDISALKLR
ncbi:MAG: TIGR00730 family Rossman fold protein [Bacilli bacterium]|nr:TIGR00730 family Rossman fold protein [Bacilli bacterium]